MTGERMTKEEILKKIQDRLGGKILKLTEKSYKRIYINIGARDLTDFVRIIFDVMGARFNTASCVDMPGAMEILYHFSFASAGLVLSLRVRLNKSNLSIESITPMMKGAEWIEREIHELFGVDFINHPNLKRLLLPDDWPEGVYPLRRDYKEEDYELGKAREGRA